MLIARDRVGHELDNLFLGFGNINRCFSIKEKILKKVFNDFPLLDKVTRQNPLLCYKRGYIFIDQLSDSGRDFISIINKIKAGIELPVEIGDVADRLDVADK